jgi:hypothetical protein
LANVALTLLAMLDWTKEGKEMLAVAAAVAAQADGGSSNDEETSQAAATGLEKTASAHADCYYCLVESKRPLDYQLSFELPYLLPSWQVMTGAGMLLMQTQFVADEKTQFAEKNLRERTSWAALMADQAGTRWSDHRGISSHFCPQEDNFFTALEVLEASTTVGRHHVSFFMAFWMLDCF